MKAESDIRKPDFERAQNAATDLLLKQDIDGLYVDIRKFTFDRPIIIDSVQNYARVTQRPVMDFICEQFDGCCVVKHPRCSIILYDDRELNECRKHWGIVHEVGHIYLEHDQDQRIEEIEAHFFAAQIIMPESVIYGIAAQAGRVTAYDIYSHFNASYESAQKRLKTFSRRGRWSCSDRDMQLLEKFKPYIDKHFHCFDWKDIIG